MINLTPPQKCLHLFKQLEKKNPNLENKTFLITEKYNGWYVRLFYSARAGIWSSPFSSANRVIPSVANLQAYLNKAIVKPNCDAFLIAELVVPDVPFEIANGILNRHETTDNVIFYFHDLILSDCPTLKAKERRNFLKDFIKPSDMLQVAPLLLVSAYHKQLWMDTFEKVLTRNGEGIVAKNADSIYQPGKRNADLLKLKMECTLDTKVVDVEISIGEQGNKGVTLVSERANGVKIRTVINSLEHQKLFEDKTKIIGKIVQIKGMNELPNGQINQPRFDYQRFDKSILDID